MKRVSECSVTETVGPRGREMGVEVALVSA